MNLALVFWVASLLGALLFFGAGLLAGRRPRAAAAGAGARMRTGMAAVPPPVGVEPTSTTSVTRQTPDPLPEVAVLRDEVAAFRTVAAVAHGEADAHRKARAALEAELSAAQAESGRLRQEVILQRTEADRAGKSEARARAEADKARTDADRARGEVERARAAVEQARTKVAELEVEEGKLSSRLTALARVEAELEERRAEVLGLRQSLEDAEAMLAASPSPSTEQTLRHDLAVKAQQLAATEERIGRLAEENARLQHATEHLARVQRELEIARGEIGELRAQGFAAARPDRPRSRASAAPAPAVPAGEQRGEVLQTLVEQVSGLGDVRCTVVADELGLVVASHGELGEEVAAVGALFGRAGLQAQQVLPLRNVQRVTVEDDQNVVLTLRPLGTPGSADADLALITLAVGNGPDPRQVNKLIHQGPGPRSVVSS
jgi:hypothetical protein